MLDPWEDVPVFGVAPTMECAVVRPSAYAIVVDDLGRVALARTREGLFLPGGGIEARESEADAVVREAREECGLVVRVLEWRARAIAFVDAPAEMMHYEKRSTFLECDVAGEATKPTEPDHECVWLGVETAAAQLTEPSHRWALLRWRDARGGAG